MNRKEDEKRDATELKSIPKQNNKQMRLMKRANKTRRNRRQ